MTPDLCIYHGNCADEPSAALRDVAAERQRQVESEGWTPEHDDKHEGGELATAGACYALERRAMDGGYWTYGGRDPELSKWIRAKPQLWPWHADWWKPASRRRDLIRAAALIVAEIERLDRQTGHTSEASQVPGIPTESSSGRDQP